MDSSPHSLHSAHIIPFFPAPLMLTDVWVLQECCVCLHILMLDCTLGFL